MTTTLIILTVVLAIATISAVAVIVAMRTKTTKTEMVEESIKTTTSSVSYTEHVVSNKRPIDKVTDFINKNMEMKGFDDAKTNCNKEFEDEKLIELREEGKQICRDAIIEYNEKIARIDVEIKRCEQNGLLETKERLEAQNKIFKEQYINEIENIKSEIEKDNTFKEKPVASSYRRGFSRWREANAVALIEDKIEVKKGGS